VQEKEEDHCSGGTSQIRYSPMREELVVDCCCCGGSISLESGRYDAPDQIMECSCGEWSWPIDSEGLWANRHKGEAPEQEDPRVKIEIGQVWQSSTSRTHRIVTKIEEENSKVFHEVLDKASNNPHYTGAMSSGTFLGTCRELITDPAEALALTPPDLLELVEGYYGKGDPVVSCEGRPLKVEGAMLNIAAPVDSLDVSGSMYATLTEESTDAVALRVLRSLEPLIPSVEEIARDVVASLMECLPRTDGRGRVEAILSPLEREALAGVVVEQLQAQDERKAKPPPQEQETPASVEAARKRSAAAVEGIAAQMKAMRKLVFPSNAARKVLAKHGITAPDFSSNEPPPPEDPPPTLSIRKSLEIDAVLGLSPLKWIWTVLAVLMVVALIAKWFMGPL